LFHTSTPLELVTVNEGEVGPTSALHVFLDLLRIDEVIFTMDPGP
jgi:hypothetical protein